ncbi:hypothetical protein J6590_099393, partial [Homalodisca vitripennis]
MAYGEVIMVFTGPVIVTARSYTQMGGRSRMYIDERDIGISLDVTLYTVIKT